MIVMNKTLELSRSHGKTQLGVANYLTKLVENELLSRKDAELIYNTMFQRNEENVRN